MTLGQFLEFEMHIILNYRTPNFHFIYVSLRHKSSARSFVESGRLKSMKKNYEERYDCQNRKTGKLLLVICKSFIKLLRTDMKAVVSNELLLNENR